MKPVIILGGGGYIASKIVQYWTSQEFVPVLIKKSDIDYLNPDKFKQLLKESNAHFIINCYGYTGTPNVDSCELPENKTECLLRNVTDGILINSRSSIPVINIGSGCVYNDESGTAIYSETDAPNFGYNNPSASFYSSCKSKFQKWFTDTDAVEKHYLLRIRMPFDSSLDDPKNYIGKIIKYDKRINYANSITHLEDLTNFVNIIMEEDIPKGIYNVVNPQAITAKEVLELGGVKPNKFYTVDDLLTDGTIKCRRSNCALSTDKIEKYYNIPSSIQRIRDTFKK